MFKGFKKLSILATVLTTVILSACSSNSIPKNPKDLCSIFQEKDDWYVVAHKAHKKYGIPINSVMAIMYHESGFKDDAKPPMRWFLFIPYGRGSSSFGYAQAQDAVWDEYKEDAGSFFSDRDDIEDSIDFICWYMQKTKKINGIDYSDVYNHYLNYHEGWTGFRNKTYNSKQWLLNIARDVQKTSDKYKEQLLRCELY